MGIVRIDERPVMGVNDIAISRAGLLEGIGRCEMIKVDRMMPADESLFDRRDDELQHETEPAPCGM